MRISKRASESDIVGYDPDLAGRKRQVSPLIVWVAAFIALGFSTWFVTRWSSSTIHYAASVTDKTNQPQYEIAGRVLDSSSGEGLPWAALTANGTTGIEFIHTSADYGGNFSLFTYPERQKLVITADGYRPQELEIGPRWFAWRARGSEQITVKLMRVPALGNSK